MDRNILGITLAGALVLSGCAFQRQTSRMAVDHNEFAAQTTNSQTVLNILRARDREAMHFTSFGSINGTVKLTAGGEASFTRNDRSRTTNYNDQGQQTTSSRGASAINSNVKASASVTTGTDFSLAVNATDDFYKGIMGPVTPPVIIHFLEQGWPADLLSNLFIEKIDFYATVRKDAQSCQTLATLRSAKETPDPECEKGGVDYPLISIGGSPTNAMDRRLLAEVIKCRTLAVSDDVGGSNEVRFGSISDISGVTDATIPKVVDMKPDGADRYSVDFSKKAPALTLALSVDKMDLARKFYGQESQSGTLKDYIDTVVKGRCGTTRAMLEDAFFDLDSLAATYLDEYAPFQRSVGELGQEPPAWIRAYKFPAAKLRLDTAVIFDKTNEKDLAEAAGKRLDELRAEREIAILEQRAGNAQVNPKSRLRTFARQFFSSATSSAFGATSDPLVSENYFKSFAKSDYQIDLKTVVTLRSVESIIYYLGEYIRENKGPLVNGEAEGQKVPIMIVKGDRPPNPSDAFVQVSFRNEDYWVPVSGKDLSKEAGRSSQVISLVQQLLNLHRSAKELPTVQTVRVAN